MDERKTSSKSRGQYVYALDEESAGESEDNSQINKGGHEGMLRPASDSSTRYQDR